MSGSSPSEHTANYRFTLSDYYSIEAALAQPAGSSSSPPPAASSSSHGRQLVGSSASHGPLSEIPPEPIQRTTTSLTQQGVATSDPVAPTIITTKSSVLFEHSYPSTNSLELNLYHPAASSSRPSLTPSPSGSTVRINTMVQPLGPGPQPYPASPDGHESIPEDCVSQTTYPPRPSSNDTHTSSAPTTPTRVTAPPRVFRPDRAIVMGSSSALNVSEYDQLSPRSPTRSTSFLGDSPRSPFSPTTPVSFETHPMGTFQAAGEGEKGLKGFSEKDAAGPSSAGASRGLGTRSTLMHKCQEWIPRSWASRAFLIVVVLQAAIDITIQANLLWRFTTAMQIFQDNNEKRYPVYLYIFVTAHIVQFVLALWALRTRNFIQVAGVAIFNVLFLVYAGIEMEEMRGILGSPDVVSVIEDASTNRLVTLPVNTLTIVSISIISVSVVAIIVLTFFLYREFGWDIYRALGADLRIRRYYFNYQVFECIVCYSFFFFAGFGVQFALLTLDTGDPEYIVTWAVLPLQLLWLGMGLLAARREMRLTMVAFLAVLLAGTAYFIFKLVRIWTRPEIYSSVRKSLSVFSVLSIIMIILTLVAGILVYRNFGKGLRRALDGRKEERKVEQLALSGVGVEAAPHRVTIE